MLHRILPVLTFCLIAIGIAAPFRGNAQTPQYIFPGSNPAFTGGGNSWPLNAAAAGSNMCQWLYLPGDFAPTPPTSGVFITAVYIKPASGATTTLTNLLIKLGNTTLTTLTTGAWNGGLTTALNPATYSITATSNAWCQFTLTTPVFYSGGALLFELSHQGSASGITVNQFSFTTRNGRLYGNSSGSGTADGTCAVFGFDCIPAACSGTPSAATITTPAFNPAAPLCAGGTTTITASNPNLGSGITQQWQSAPTATGPWTNVTGGSGATTTTYTTGPIPTNTYFRMGVTCTNSNLTTYSAAFLVPTGAAQPATIQGSSTFCPGDPSTYMVPNVVGSTYAWTLPSGWTGTSTTNSITVTPGTASGTISVIATSPCGTSIAQTRAIVPGSAPAPPASITGNRFICSNTPQTYSVSPVAGAVSYIWTLPSGWTGTSTTNTITANNTTTSGNLSVQAVNGCGQSLATVIPVSVITSLANPGPITGKDTVCSGTLQSYSIQPVNGATSYVWTLPTGWSGSTTGTSIQVFGGTASGPISVTAYVSCATSPISSKSLTAITTVNPAVTLSSPPSTLCQGTSITFTATATGGGTAPIYTWRRNGSIVSGTANTYTTNTLATGETISVTLNTNAVCASAASVTSTPLNVQITPSVTPGISINTLPITTICRGTNVDFQAFATGGGPQPTYQWFLNGSPIPNATSLQYSSATLNDNDTLVVTMTSNAVCATQNAASSNKVGMVVAASLTPTVSITVSPSPVLVLGTPVTFTATQSNGGAKPDYQWLLNGVKIPFADGDTYETSDLLPNDHISVRMFSYLSCASPKVAVSNYIQMLRDPLGVGGTTASTGNDMTLYPNPSSGQLSLRGEAAVNGGLRVEVLSAIGQIVHRVELPAGGASAGWHHELELPSSLANGHYILRVSTQTESAARTLATLPFVLRK